MPTAKSSNKKQQTEIQSNDDALTLEELPFNNFVDNIVEIEI